jgi:hypothetical protein
VAGCCEYGDEPSSYSTTEIVYCFTKADTFSCNIFVARRLTFFLAISLLCRQRIVIDVIVAIIVIIYLVLIKLFDWKSNILFILDKLSTSSDTFSCNIFVVRRLTHFLAISLLREG